MADEHAPTGAGVPDEEPTVVGASDDPVKDGPVTDDAAAADSATGAASDAGAGTDDASTKTADGADGVDLKGIFRQLTAPMIESLDSRLREQVEAHVDEQLTVKLDAALADRLSTVDRAIADLSRTLDELRHRVSLLESHGDDLS